MLIQIVFQQDYCNSLKNCIHLLQTRFLEFDDLKEETGSEPLLVKLDPSRQTVQLNLKKRFLVLRKNWRQRLHNSYPVFVKILLHILIDRSLIATACVGCFASHLNVVEK